VESLFDKDYSAAGVEVSPSALEPVAIPLVLVCSYWAIGVDPFVPVPLKILQARMVPMRLGTENYP